MLGYTKDGTEPVGQEQFEAMMVKKNMRVEVKNICRALCEQNHTMRTGNAQTAKQLLRIALISTCAIRTDGQYRQVLCRLRPWAMAFSINQMCGADFFC